MGAALPAKYTLILFLVTALLHPVAGLALGEPFTDPTVAELLVLPLVLVLFANIGYFVRTRRGGAGVVDERDVRNIDFALAVTGGILLIALLGMYVGYSMTSDGVPPEVDYLALTGVVAICVGLGGTELYQRL